MRFFPWIVVLLGGGGLIWSVLSSTGNAGIYFNPQGLFIVAGGSFTAAVLSYPPREFFQAMRGIRDLFRQKSTTRVQLTEWFSELSETIIVHGVSGLEKQLESGEFEHPYMKLGLGMVADQIPIEKIEKVLESTLENEREREMIAPQVARSLAKYAPAFGMAGTLIGMIEMFQVMGGDLDGIGPAMAVAMMTTFYGLLLANLLWTPCAVKLERQIEDRMLDRSLILEGILLLARKTPPPLVRQELGTFLEPEERDG